MMQLILAYCVTTSILTTCFLTQKQKLYHWLSDEKKKNTAFPWKISNLAKAPVGPLTGATAKKTMRSSARLCCAFFKWDFSSGKRLKTCRVWQACGVLSGMGFWRERSVVVLLFFHTAQQWLVDFATLYFMFLNSFRNVKFQCNMDTDCIALDIRSKPSGDRTS